jgi:hypothetical protein
MARITILHPSYGRPELARKCYDEWMGKAKNPQDVEYVLCLSSLDPHLHSYGNFGEAKVVFLMGDNGLVKQVNYAAQHSTGNLLIAVSDDFGCPRDWDEQLLTALDGKQDYIVKTQDGLQPFIITLPIMDRLYYNRFGYIYHPDYFHMWADAELADVGKALGKTITLDLTFPHRHYSTGKMKKDATNIQNDSHFNNDRVIYEKHKADNWGLPAETSTTYELK